MMVKKRIPIIKAGAAVLLQAKLPNPTWFRGYVGGYFSVLGGLIKGKFRFKVTIGEECEVVNSGPLDDIKVIADFSPADKSEKVDVFAVPQVVFNMPVGKTFALDDDQGSKNYRIKMDEYKVTKDGNAIPGTIKWNTRNDAVFFESTEILPPNSTIKAFIKITFEQQSGTGWQTVYDNGQPAVEQKEISFTTGAAPETIPLSNIAYSYPVVDQQYFYTKQYNKGYIKLKRGQAYLFNTASYKHEAVFDNGDNNNALHVSFDYDSSSQKIQFNLPDITKSKAYAFALQGTPTASKEDDIQQTSQNITINENEVQIAENKAGELKISDRPRTYLTYNFATSRYERFNDKMASKTIQRPLYEIVLSDVGALQVDVSGDEGFDISELTGSDYTASNPLIQPVAELSDRWFVTDINPLIYSGYPLVPSIELNRDTAVMGFPPAKAIEPIGFYLNANNSNSNNPLLKMRFPYRYTIGYYYKSDFINIQNAIVNRWITNPANIPDEAKRFITSGFPIMRTGKYKVRYRYVLPGNIVSQEYLFEFENPLK